MNRHLWLWHRRLGAAVAVMVILLCITGIALNHSDRLDLDQRHVGTGWLLDWYGIAAPQSGLSLRTGSREVTLLGDHLYVDDALVGAPFSNLQGAVEAAGLLVIAAGGDVLLLTADLELVERLGHADGVPAGLAGLAFDGGGIVARDGNGTTWRADADLVGWQPAGPVAGVEWPEAHATAAERVARLAADFRGRILSMEKLMLDLHSGRLFGRFGPMLMDAVGLMMLVLSFTGIWLWTRSRT
ncbi:MAG: PepSY domain-containing protein [Gammaproteobacteria bacterium]|nr:PepSY domain-containing protein [Gammaproteobacteria bacterium]MDH4254652.1 PepSY domain-containing protein [Gammaproteobacteria bacterium]MDH5308335.1 PepSY domain-containing protein [Gammaproteobacteria bacterium]